MTSLHQLEKLTRQAEQLKRALYRADASRSPCAVISVSGSLFDSDGTMNGFIISFYPEGKLNVRNATHFRNQTPEDIKSFTDANPDLEYFIDWGGCIEWEVEHKEDPKEKEHCEKLLLNYYNKGQKSFDIDFRSDLLKEALRDFPPYMHYIGNRHKTEVTK